MPISDQFSGLPMDSLISAPLNAAVKAQAETAKATFDFISAVGAPTCTVPALDKEQAPPED